VRYSLFAGIGAACGIGILLVLQEQRKPKETVDLLSMIQKHGVVLGKKQLDEKIEETRKKHPSLFSRDHKDTNLDKAFDFHVTEKNDIEFENPLIVHIDKQLLYAYQQAITPLPSLTQLTSFSTEREDANFVCGLSILPIANIKRQIDISRLKTSPDMQTFYHTKSDEKEVWIFDRFSEGKYEVECYTFFFQRGDKRVFVMRNVYYSKKGETNKMIQQQREKWIERMGVKNQDNDNRVV